MIATDVLHMVAGLEGRPIQPWAERGGERTREPWVDTPQPHKALEGRR